MSINKILYGNEVLIDLTSDTVQADKLLQGYTAHDRTGALITGTATGGIDGDNMGYGGSLNLAIIGTGQIGTGRVV